MKFRCLGRWMQLALPFGMLLGGPFLPLAFPQPESTTRTETAWGLHTATFDSPRGKVVVNLPDDIMPGDTISGTVTVEPAGKDDRERKKNRGELSGYVVEMEKQQSVARASTARWSIPARLAGPALTLLLRDNKGKEVSRAIIPHSPQPAQPNAVVQKLPPASADYQLPPLAQTGRPMEIVGPFDGDAGNTSCTVGGQEVRKIAESPRKLIAESPAEIAGPTRIVLKEGVVEAKGNIQNIRVQLSAPKNNLLRGELTTMTVQVSGLQGIKEDLPIRLDCTGVVSMEGGNAQSITIHPADVGPDGTFTRTRTLTGQQAGGFSVAGRVDWAKPINHDLQGQIVHIEGTPNGGSGLWFVKIKTVTGEEGTIRLQAQEKPALRYCNWIRVVKAHTNDWGNPYVDDYEMTKAPAANPPAPPPEKPKPPKDETKIEPPTEPTAPPPCKENEERNASKPETVSFEVLDPESEITVRVYTDVDGAVNAAKNMADFWKTSAKLLNIIKKVAPRVPGKTPAGLLIEYLEQGGSIVEALAGSKLARRVGKIEIDVMITTTVITVEWSTVEVCRNGVWVSEKRCKESRAKGVFRDSETIKMGDENWDSVADAGNPNFVDPKKVDQRAKDFLKKKAEALGANEDAYSEFKKSCK